LEKPGVQTASLSAALPVAPPATQAASSPSKVLTVTGFTSFLLSQDNSAFSDIDANVYQDMTRPLSEYYISSSHNTYLVGHQLVGVSTIEGYIRALLHGCRSVER
jgi:phosphatidylinositol phospholipase C delta